VAKLQRIFYPTIVLIKFLYFINISPRTMESGESGIRVIRMGLAKGKGAGIYRGRAREKNKNKK
jgi:hypothetical protein